MIREEGGFETGGTRSQRATVSLFKSRKLTLMLGLLGALGIFLFFLILKITG